jgi:3-(3-hydroxy-phenyl)propionate hydroxylase
VLHEFEKLGILDEVVEAGYKNQEGMCFRTPSGGTNKVLAKIPPGQAPQGGIDYGVQLGQPILTRIIRKHARKCPKFTIYYKSRFVDLQEQDDFATVEIQPEHGANVFKQLALW